jgi:hypothetical protein
MSLDEGVSFFNTLMRLGRRTIFLITASAVFFIAFYLCSQQSVAVEDRPIRNTSESKDFSFSDTLSEWNYWDAAALCSLVLAGSTFVVGIWTVRRN